MILRLEYLYILVGIMLLAVAGMTLSDKDNPRRFSTALFWAIYSMIFLVGDKLPPQLVGGVVIVLALIAGFGGVGMGRHRQLSDAERKANAARLGNRLFVPALTIPLVTVIGAVLLPDLKFGELALFDRKNVTLLSLGVGCVVALLVAQRLTRDSTAQSVRESRRLLEAMGWAVILPQMLATLGILFTEAGVGKGVSYLTRSYLAVDYRFVAVAAYCIGMALFTMIMGNAFAAFPVITAGIGVPILVGAHHGDAAVMAAIGMFCGYCGTLMTPMAANFNIVPAALLELPDKNAVIKVQIPTALAVLCANIVLLYFLMFR